MITFVVAIINYGGQDSVVVVLQLRKDSDKTRLMCSSVTDGSIALLHETEKLSFNITALVRSDSV